MDSLSKQELISTITKQADQIKRYESRLRDVVAAYKGLVKEKEALEISLKALNKTENLTTVGQDESVAALTLSLSTLSAEKSRMEEAFQTDKKVTREKYENQLAAMREETKSLVQQHLVETNNLKAKIAFEIQEREKERANHAAMLKELQMKLNSERKTKEKFEDKVVHTSESQACQAELEKRVRDLSSALEAAQRRMQRAEARGTETPEMLVRLQNKLAFLEQSHSVAIREEQIKSMRAAESARKWCARQEERASGLEARVAELSAALAQAHAARRRDSTVIQRLQHAVSTRDAHAHDQIEQKSETDNEKLADSEYLKNLIDKIHILKKEIISENDKLGCPLDISTIFSVDGYENVHFKCTQELEKVKAEFEVYKANNVIVNTKEDSNEIEALKTEMALLKDKLENCSLLLIEEKQDKADMLKLHEEKLKHEQEYHKEVMADLKARTQSLEKQVHTQRERYSALLEETDNYIRARNDRSRKVSSEDGALSEGACASVCAGGGHVLHYAQELARRDLDISLLRKEKHLLEGHYRDCQRESTIEKERFKEVIRTLKEEIDRLRRIQSREGSNLEYVKNVVVAYMRAGGHAARRSHMRNAIAAALHFTPQERDAVRDTD